MITIRELHNNDINLLVDSFANHNWQKPTSLFEGYVKEQQEGIRQAWVAFIDQKIAGYVTLNWHSHYEPFATHNIPEIMDLNVLPPFRCRGVGSRLLATAEEAARGKSSIVGLGVGLYDGYGHAQKLYVKHGYIPDGNGPTYNYAPLSYGQSVLVDDDLVLWFTKTLIDNTIARKM